MTPELHPNVKHALQVMGEKGESFVYLSNVNYHLSDTNTKVTDDGAFLELHLGVKIPAGIDISTLEPDLDSLTNLAENS